MRARLHDVSVLFDDDGRVYAVWGYNEVKMVQLTPDLMDVVPGKERVIIKADSGAGEGSHIYKLAASQKGTHSKAAILTLA